MKRFFIITIVSFLSTSAYTQSDSITASPTSSKSLKIPILLERITPERITYFSIFTGPNLGGANDPVDEFGEVQEDSISTWNQVSFQWKINETKRFVVNPRFSINHNIQEGDALEWEDPVFGVAGRWFKFGDLTFGGGLNTILPVARTEGTREDEIIFNPGGFNSIDYQLTPKMSIGSWVWGRAFFYEGRTDIDDTRYAFFLAPQINYNFTDKLGATVFYQFDGDANKEYDMAFDTNQTLNVLTTISLSKYITLQPMITLFQESDFKLANGNFNMWLSGRVF